MHNVKLVSLTGNQNDGTQGCLFVMLLGWSIASRLNLSRELCRLIVVDGSLRMQEVYAAASKQPTECENNHKNYSQISNRLISPVYSCQVDDFVHSLKGVGFGGV